MRNNIIVITSAVYFISLFCAGFVYPAKSEVDMVLDNLHWLGHASFRLDASKVIYFDPWKLSKGSLKAGIILVTHEHYDHFSLEDIKLISTKDTVIVSGEEVAVKLRGQKALCKEIKTLLPGNSLEVEGIKIASVASYNTNKQFHTKGSKKLGFIVTVWGIRIYHAGDTDLIPEMKDYACDIALLPVGGTYTMSADEAAGAALMIKPKVAIPMHYGDIVGNASDAQRLSDLLNGKIEVRILKKEN